MLNQNEKIKIFNLLDAGFSSAEISRRTEKSIGTVYKFKKVHTEKKEVKSEPFSESSKILPAKDFVDSQVRKGITNSMRLYRDARMKGYKGSYGHLNSYVRKLITKEGSYKRSKHVETAPGEQAQVDWGSFGKIMIGDRLERLYAFVYVLSYSRALYVEFVVRQNQQTFQSCHVHAFEKLGIPKNIRYDNIKTVVLSREKLRDGSAKPHFNPTFLDFAQYYGFQSELCPPYWPRSKGKVEAGVKYLRNNFMLGEVFGKTFHSIDELNKKVERWIENVAQRRIHRSTGKEPLSLWVHEKKFLHFPTGLPPYNTAPFFERRSTKDGLVQYKSNLYSVPSKYAQKKLYVREIQKYGSPILEIYYKDFLAAVHAVSSERGKWIIDDLYTLESNQKNSPVRRIVLGKIKSKKLDLVVATRDLNYYDSAI